MKPIKSLKIYKDTEIQNGFGQAKCEAVVLSWDIRADISVFIFCFTATCIFCTRTELLPKV